MTRHIKRLFDVVAALAALTVLSPVLLVTALAILLTMGRPIFFRQVRPGYRGRPFTMVKFRTLRQAVTGSDGTVYSDVERLTPLGAFLRRMSIDELPQLWNVLTGSMSIVGPRPLLMEYLPLYTPEQARRHAVKPGITGWAQVNGRQAIGFQERFVYDVWYVDHWSLRLDLRILGRTIAKVFRATGMAGAAGVAEPAWTGCEPPLARSSPVSGNASPAMPSTSEAMASAEHGDRPREGGPGRSDHGVPDAARASGLG